MERIDEMIEMADAVIIIPIQGMIQSLNVSVATAPILYEAERQLENTGRYYTSMLSTEKKKRHKRC